MLPQGNIYSIQIVWSVAFKNFNTPVSSIFLGKMYALVKPLYWNKRKQQQEISLRSWPNGWVFVYELSGSGFESSCSHKHGSLEFRLKKIDETRNYLFVEIKHGLMS